MGHIQKAYLLVLISNRDLWWFVFVMLWLVGSVTIGAVAARRFTGQDRALLAGLAGAVTCYIIASLWRHGSRRQNLALAAFVSDLGGDLHRCQPLGGQRVGEDALGGTPGQEVQNPVEVLEA